MSDCLVFLLRGKLAIKGQGWVEATGCAYRIKDEQMVWLLGTATIVIMEEGEQRGVCTRDTRRFQELWAEAHKGDRKTRKRAKKELKEMGWDMEAGRQCQQM